ncbi:diguanylate cyclase [Paraglaciecola aquimarina]|uniref:diguanylate cyclase n=1 Tax=Paraglaciecola aquimarina TaxID=1235557 RepID=A0ABU3SS55_9ALTE|nr:diguanylate cyclase [Paraglaciecola aquimarina]MDU0352812.1 diguanylate cyclase [Paraglaciecola aquimarina]
MIKYIVVLLFSLYVCQSVFADEAKVELLRTELVELPLGAEERIAPLLELSHFYLFVDPKKAAHYASQVLTFPDATLGQFNKAKALRLLGHAEMYQGLNQLAFTHLNQAIDSAILTENPHLISTANRVLGVLYELLVDHENAMKLYLEALKFAKKSGDLRDLAMIYNNLGNMLNTQNDYSNAAVYFEKSIKINTEINDIEMQMNATVGLSVSLLKSGKPMTAKKLLLKVIDSKAHISDFSFSEASVTLAHVYKALNELSAAQDLYRFVIDDKKGGAYPPAVAAAYLGLAEVLIKTDRIDQAIALYRTGIVEVKDKISVESEMALYEKLAELELSQEYFRAAANTQAKYIKRRNVVQPLIQKGMVEKLESQLKQERDYIKLQEELLVSERESRLNAWYLLAGIVFSLLSLVLFLVLMLRKQAISRLEASNQNLKLASETDPLTGAGNRRFLEHKIGQIKGKSVPLAFLLLDLDHFKRINDTFGHDVGDQVLVAIAEAIGKVCRENDSFARIGGEEFVILNMCKDIDSARSFAERMRICIENMSHLHKLNVTASIGVVMGNMQFANYDELYKKADIALYMAKGQGRNRVEVYAEK